MLTWPSDARTPAARPTSARMRLPMAASTFAASREFRSAIALSSHMRWSLPPHAVPVLSQITPMVRQNHLQSGHELHVRGMRHGPDHLDAAGSQVCYAHLHAAGNSGSMSP